MATNNAINDTINDYETTALTIDPGASGDSYVQFNINTTGEFRIGVDDTDGDAFVISQGSALGTNNTFHMTAAGERTMPLQPAFSAVLSALATNVTGDGTAYTAACNSEIYDQGSDYNNTTFTFTAPVTGRYILTGLFRLLQLGAGHTSGKADLVTSNRTYTSNILNYAAARTVTTIADEVALGMTVHADMDASDTATFTITIYNSTLTVDASANSTNFAGVLLC